MPPPWQAGRVGAGKLEDFGRAGGRFLGLAAARGAVHARRCTIAATRRNEPRPLTCPGSTRRPRGPLLRSSRRAGPQLGSAGVILAGIA